MEFNTLLERERQKLGWSIEDLSKKCGISVITLKKYEGGYAVPTLESFVKLSSALEKSPNEMLDGVSFSNCLKVCNLEKQNKSDYSIRLLTKDEKIQYIKSLKTKGVRLYSAYLQRKLGIEYDEAQELLQIVNSMG